MNIFIFGRLWSLKILSNLIIPRDELWKIYIILSLKFNAVIILCIFFVLFGIYEREQINDCEEVRWSLYVYSSTNWWHARVIFSSDQLERVYLFAFWLLALHSGCAHMSKNACIAQ